MNVTRSVRARVPLRRVNVTRAVTRCTRPGLIRRGSTFCTNRPPRFGFVSVRTVIASTVNVTRRIWLPRTVTSNGAPAHPVLPVIVADPRSHSVPPTGAGPGAGVHADAVGSDVLCCCGAARRRRPSAYDRRRHGADDGRRGQDRDRSATSQGRWR